MKTKKLRVNLPPSNNNLYVKTRNHLKPLTPEAREYIYEYSKELASILYKEKHISFDDYFYLDIHWVLPRKNADSHNYKKVLFDFLEKGGFVTNDRYIMDRTQSVKVDPKNPHVVLEWVA